MIDETDPFGREDFRGKVVREYAGLSEDEADRLVLDELRGRGSDLSVPRHIVHHLWFETAADREHAAVMVQNSGYGVGLPDQEQRREPFLMRAERTGIADGASLRMDRLLLSELAAAHGGWYDGWAAAED